MNEEGGLYNMAEPMEQPNYVLQFKEGSYVPKHESRTPLYKVEIHGVTEATFYKYNKDGTLILYRSRILHVMHILHFIQCLTRKLILQRYLRHINH